MTQRAQIVARFLTNGGELRTRLRERSWGDTHDSPTIFAAALGMVLAPDDIILALQELHHQGVVVRSETVHPFDSSEYLVTWRTATEKRAEKHPY
ncbi:MAG: hypothetical protein AB7G75_22720 [Candidatus Binatia bacterium]